MNEIWYTETSTETGTFENFKTQNNRKQSSGKKNFSLKCFEKIELKIATCENFANVFFLF